ncbi:hypothetical protein [Pseudoalteromonas espejiana]|nr:hypothetical protein [Pseudoalteromonas espejiana]
MIIVFIIFIVLLMFAFANYFGKSTLTSENRISELMEFSNISKFNFYLYDEVVDFKSYELSSDSVALLDFSNDGVSLNIDDGFSLIEFEYNIQFTVDNRVYYFSHYANLSDAKTPEVLYENYYYDDGELSKNIAYRRFEIVAYWSICKLFDKFNSEFNEEKDFVESIGLEMLDELKSKLTFVRNFNC